MKPEIDTRHHVASTLYRYCELIDEADFDGFADLFAHGTWFMVDRPGAEPVRQWLSEHVELHNGRTHTRHEIANLRVEQSEDDATFHCYVSIWQDLPDQLPNLMVHAVFTGRFRRLSSAWHWVEHSAELRYVGDVSRHLRNFALPGLA